MKQQFFSLQFFFATAFHLYPLYILARNTMFNIRHDIKSKMKICNRKTCRGVTKNKSICLCISSFRRFVPLLLLLFFFLVVCFQLHFSRDIMRVNGGRKRNTTTGTVKYMKSHYEALMGKLASFVIIYLLFEIT